VSQRLEFDVPAGLTVRTEGGSDGRSVGVTAWAEADQQGRVVCRMRVEGALNEPGWLAVALRPYNPEGISSVKSVSLAAGGEGLTVNRSSEVAFDTPADRFTASTYTEGDVHDGLLARSPVESAQCEAGMATAAALFAVKPDVSRAVTVSVALDQKENIGQPVTDVDEFEPWEGALSGAASLDVPDAHYRFLYDAAVRSLVLHTHRETYPGPFTYKRFWFRDAAFILNALASIGLARRVEPVLDGFGARQTASGFFRSQDGEWDSNGAALWTYERYCALTGQAPKDDWRQPIARGASWLERKRTSEALDALHAGLLPAGFSAEHLGNNDFYYWDDFWGIAGLRAAARMARGYDGGAADHYEAEAERFLASVTRSLERSAGRRKGPGIPASPYRRMDAGAVGSLVGAYPLGVLEPRDARLLGTAGYLLEHCLVRGGFYQDMIHSGINVYLTLHLAQVLLRAGDDRWGPLVRAVAVLASPTGQWPEAVHPRTGGGCMGDGQHVWASAEWVMMMRSLFVREEADRLVVGSGLVPEWLEPGENKPLRFGPTATPWGTVTVTATPSSDAVDVHVEAQWHDEPPQVELAVPGTVGQRVTPGPGGFEARVLRGRASAPTDED
jgi:hypothetical protein